MIGTGELAVILGAVIGAGLGFLWFNAPPAAIFMGDNRFARARRADRNNGSGTKHEIVMGIIGGLFVMEAMSVIIQVGWFKLTGRRVFLMAPIHHHFEKLGWTESQVVVRFWIISFILALTAFRHSSCAEGLMIPVTTLSGKKVALFGLGGSGIATAEALVAGGAKVIAWDDNPASVEAAKEKGIATADLHTVDWKEFDSFILSPGVPLTHPKPH